MCLTVGSATGGLGFEYFVFRSEEPQRVHDPFRALNRSALISGAFRPHAVVFGELGRSRSAEVYRAKTGELVGAKPRRSPGFAARRTRLGGAAYSISSHRACVRVCLIAEKKWEYLMSVFMVTSKTRGVEIAPSDQSAASWTLLLFS